MDFLNEFIKKLLHLDDGKANKLINLGDMSSGAASRSNERTYLLTFPERAAGELMLNTIRERRGKSSNQVALNNSAMVPSAVVGSGAKWDWRDLNGVTSVDNLHDFIFDAYKELNLKGNNPLFLGVGSLSWNALISDRLETVHSPLLIFPVRLVRGSPTSLVELDFVDDDAYFNPCLINLLKDLYPDVADKFPHPNGEGADFDEALDLDALMDGNGYFRKVDEFIKQCVDGNSRGAGFALDKNTVAISLYNHSDICMYYDVRRNKDRIHSSKLIAKVFGLKEVATDEATTNAPKGELKFVLPKDSVQKKLITRVANGESLVIKGPPGTGKTLTIANMVAVLLAQGKRVMFTSKKLSALSEVNNKLPENLRKFVMMLAYETERQAANINPSTIREDFRSLLRYKQQHSRDTTLITKLNAAVRNRNDAVLSLIDYFNAMFGTADVAGKNYYDALDSYFEYSHLPTFDLAQAENLQHVTFEQLQHAKTLVEEAGKHFEKIKGDGAFSRSPWLNVKATLNIDEDLLPTYRAICKELSLVFGALKDNAEYISELPIGIITELSAQQVLTADDVLKILSVSQEDKLYESLRDALRNWESKKQFANLGVRFGKGACDSLQGLFSTDVDKTLTVAQLKKIVNCKQTLFANGQPQIDAVAMNKLIEAVDQIAEKKVAARTSQLEALAVFDKPLSDKQIKLILKSYDVLKDCQGKPSFKASRAAKKLAALSSRPLVSFQQVVTSTVEYYNFYQNSNEVASLLRLIAVILGKAKEQFDEKDSEALALTLHNSKTLKMDVEQYFAQVENVLAQLSNNDAVEILSDNVTVQDVANALDLRVAMNNLSQVVLDVCEKAQVNVSCDDLPLAAQTVAAALELGKYAQQTDHFDDNQKEQIVNAVLATDKQIVDKLVFVINSLSGVGQLPVVNYYTSTPRALTLEDLRYFTLQATDRNVAGSAIRYYQLIEQAEEIMPVRKMFEQLEQETLEVAPLEFAQLLEHSFLWQTINYRLSKMGNARNGMGHQAVANLEKYDAAEKEIAELNAKIVEQACLDKIDCDDEDFAFLTNDRGAKMTMRALFKTYASAVWKLKRCFILSPSTASVLFRPEIYNDFDVVIVDEASQLEPVYLLPILMRAKQCVLVGDEHQMPPITHFKAKNNKLIEDYERELTIDKDISALSLALVNQAFDSEELICHYRSNTEALIAFSQKSFYPYMRTFPAALPFDEGLGFVDAYVENGRCVDGVNAAEVDKTVELLRAHFDKYFDHDHDKLQDGASVGVVAFGEAQLNAILKRVESDDQLNTLINKACGAVDVDDKAVFFRTIESVQGQETDHLILSLTYGKDKNGKAQNRFGELNRDDFGKCIFNVAVTRAKSSVTLVRSVEPYELDSNSRIGFIVEYMRLVKQFAKADDKQQFVSNAINKGAHFVKEVARYVETLGVAPERIVTGYGVTDGSIRIPIAVLSRDLKTAVLGIWCELPTEKKYDYFDYNLLYYNSLRARNWNMHRVSIHEWFDNKEAEMKLLKNKIQQIL